MESLYQPEPIRGGLYVVGYFDLLGQSNTLAPFVDIEGSQDYVEEVRLGFSRVSSQLFAFRSDIETFFEGARSAGLAASAPEGMPAEALVQAADLESEPIRLQGFSDTVVAYVPIATKAGARSLYGVGAMLISVASTMLLSIARGTIVRGAIEASWAMEPYEKEIYGPALMCAYELERNAGWPRVVLGNGIQKLWQMIISQSDPTVADRLNIVFARLQSSLSFRDVDGQVAVDYLGPSMRWLIENEVDDLAVLIDAAQVELERQLAMYADDAKIHLKLQATLDYFVSRVGPLDSARRESAKAYAKLRHPS